MTNSGFWSFDWLFGKMKTRFGGEDMYGPEDGQFMAFGTYPYSRSRNRVISSYEQNKRPMLEYEEKARLELRKQIADSKYEMEQYKNRRVNLKKKRVYLYN